LPHSFDRVVSNLPPGHFYTADQLIDEHTLLPLFFAPFVDSARYQQAKLDMRGNGGAGIRTQLGLSSGGIRLPNRLRHCAGCDAENRDRYGETFWAQLHQIAGVNICPVHRCFLQNTSVTRSSRGVFKVSSAESVCRDCTPRYLDDCDLEQVIQFKIAREAMPTITGAIDARRRITRQSLL
jgi:TniQ